MKLRAVGAFLVGAGVVLGLAPSVSAGADPSLTAFKIPNVQIASAGCHDVPIRVRFDSRGWQVDHVNVPVHHGSAQVGSLAFTPDDSSSTLAWATMSWCP